MTTRHRRTPLSVGYRRHVGRRVAARLAIGLVQLPLGLLAGAAAGALVLFLCYPALEDETGADRALIWLLVAGLAGSAAVTGLAVYRILTPPAALRGDLLTVREGRRTRRVHLAAARTVQLDAADRAVVEALDAGRAWHAGDPVPSMTVVGPGPGGATHPVTVPLTSRDGVPLPPDQYVAIAAAFAANPAAADAAAWLRRSAQTRLVPGP